MDHLQFFKKTEKMRKLQKQYFQTRSPYLLKECKKIEMEIDDEIKRVNDIITNGKGLFDKN